MIETYIFQHALGEFARIKRLFGWFLLVAVLYLLAGLFSATLKKADPAAVYGQMVLAMAYHILPLVAAVYATAIVSAEVEQKTIVYLLTRPIPRWKLLLFRTLAAILVVFAITMAAVSILALSSGQVGTAAYMRDVLGVFVGSCAYVSFFLLISLVSNRAMLFCMLYAFAWETAMPNIPGDLYHLSIYSYLRAIGDHVVPQRGGGIISVLSGQNAQSTLTPSGSFIAMILFSVVCVGISLWWFSHFEYVAREDAE